MYFSIIMVNMNIIKIMFWSYFNQFINNDEPKSKYNIK